MAEKSSKKVNMMKYDSRLVDLNKQLGLVTEKELADHMSQLPDVQAKSRPLAINWSDKGDSN